MSYPATYIDQSRALLDRQRRVFDEERSLFDQERAMWETERRALYARIKELETLTRKSDALTTSGDHPLQWQYNSSKKPSNVGIYGQSPQSSGTVDVGNKDGPSSSRHPSLPESGEKFWEGGSSRSRSNPSRVFATTAPDDGGLTAIAEIPGLTIPGGREPTQSGSQAGRDPIDVSHGVDISLVQHDLDGITLKTSAVPAKILSNLTSPVSPPSAQFPAVNDASSGSGRTSLAAALSEVNLTKDAGHTPNAPTEMEDLATGVDETDDGVATPTQTQNLHRPSLAMTAGNASAILSDSDEENGNRDEDRPLAGPLSLPTEGESAPDSSLFLQVLDSKLLHAARTVVHRPSDASSVSKGGSSTEGDVQVVVHPSGSSQNGDGNSATHDDVTGADNRHHTNEEQEHGREQKKQNDEDGAAIIQSSSASGQDPGLAPALESESEPDVKLRFKRSMNFGSAFGANRLGRS